MSSGGRSDLYSRSLARRGVTTLNYRQSIFGWCHAGLPLQSPDGEPSLRVHPYWTIFLLPAEYEPTKGYVSERFGRSFIR